MRRLESERLGPHAGRGFCPTNFDLRGFNSYDEAIVGFEWDLPSTYNIAADVCDRHASSVALAARRIGPHGVDTATFAELYEASNRLASSLIRLGFGRGSRICTILPNRIEALVAFLAIAKIGGIAITLRWHQGTDLFGHELKVAEPDAIIYDTELTSVLEPFLDHRPWVPAGPETWRQYQKQVKPDRADLLTMMLDGDPTFQTAETSRDDPVLVSFTSGSTGLSKGVVQAHRFVRGALPAFQMVTDLGPKTGDVFFSSLGWATMGGLRSIVLPAWRFGLPVVAADLREPSIETQCSILSEQRVSVAYLMPAILKQMRHVGERIHNYDWSALRVVISSGEGIGTGLHEWLQNELHAKLNPYYGQTEVAVVVSTCPSWFASQPGSVGRLVPGHSIRLADSESSTDNEPSIGTMVVPPDDPGLFLGYVHAESSEIPQGHTGHYVTEDIFRVDNHGYFYYVGREGDRIQLPRGRTVAAAEIEDVFAEVAGVIDASAVQIPTNEGTAALVLCLSLDAGGLANTDRVVGEVCQTIESDLPSDAWPDNIALMRSFPKTKLTNKVNRKALRNSLLSGKSADLVQWLRFSEVERVERS